MDWTLAVDRHLEALRRVVIMLVAMAGMSVEATPVAEDQSLFARKGAAARKRALAERSRLSPAFTLPRYLYRAVLKLLRPAEAAARRLIIVAARGLVLPPPRLREPKPKSPEPMLRGFGIAVTMSREQIRRAAAARRAAELRAARPQKLSLPLFDPLKPWSVRPWPVAADGSGVPFRRLPAGDAVDATRLALRLRALAAALNDLPGQARRFARWRARNEAMIARDKQRREAGNARSRRAGKAARFRRIWPLKPGWPPGWRKKPTHDIHEVLNDVHGLAFDVLQRPDTS
ncbi:hypothetical protein [Mesorhizobium sp. CN2-181]|uniref:hypothetical protein n=1 Tax=Mesorhizobium yinganensis TaxID=3157707 RepID=UPI0032B84FA7